MSRPDRGGAYPKLAAIAGRIPPIDQVALLRDAVRIVANRLDQATKDPATAGNQVANALVALDYAREAAAELARAFPVSLPPPAKDD